MKRLIAINAIILCMMMACQKKTVPVITERNTAPPKKFDSNYPPKETVPPDTLAGKRIYTSRCGRCHDLPTPAQFTVARWDDILPTMFPRARLSNEEALHVRTWVLVNAGK
jgi:cytochrome c5